MGGETEMGRWVPRRAPNEEPRTPIELCGVQSAEVVICPQCLLLSLLAVTNSHTLDPMYRYTSAVPRVPFQTTTVRSCHDEASQNLFAGAESCSQFVKYTASVEHEKTKQNKIYTVNKARSGMQTSLSHKPTTATRVP